MSELKRRLAAPAWVAYLRGQAPGAAVVRRLVPAVVALSLIGWLWYLAERAGTLGCAAGVGLVTLTNVVIVVCVTVSVARALDRAASGRDQAIAALRESEQVYQSLVEQLPQAVFRLDREGRITFANRRYCEQMGREPGELVGKTDADLFPAELAARYWADSRRVMDTGEVFDAVERHLDPDGRESWVEVVKSPVRAADGVIVGLQCMFRQATDRLRAEAALRENEQRLRELMQHARCGLWSGEVEAVAGAAPEAPMREAFRWSVRSEPDEEAPQKLIPLDVGEARNYIVTLYRCMPEQDQKAKDALGLEALRRGDDHYTQEFSCTDRNGQEHRLYEQISLTPVAPGRWKAFGVYVDVTERRRAEEARQASEEYFRRLTEALPQLVWTCTPDGSCDYVSQQWLRYTGRAQSEQLGFGWLEQLHADDRSTFTAAWNAAVAAGTSFELEFRLRRHDGAYGWFDTRAVPLRDAAGMAVRWLASGTDVTERKAVQERVRTSEEWHRVLFESSREAILTAAPPSWRFSSGNPAAIAMFGAADEAELTTRAPWEFSPLEQPDGRPSEQGARENIVTALREGSHAFEWQHQRLDGKMFPTTVLLTRFELDGQPMLQAVIRDITAQKQAEEERQRLVTAIEQSDEVILITDDRGVIVFANPAFERVTGYTRAEALGQTPALLRSGRHDLAFYRQLWETITSGETWQGQIINKRKDGSLFETQVTISPVRDQAGRIVNYIASELDVTHAVELEARLNQAQKLEAVARLAGGVAHDFNNMLGVILGYAEMAQGEVEPDTQLHQDLADIIQAAERSADITRQLLIFARQEVTTPKVVDLNDAVEGMLKMLRRLIGENVELAWRPAAGLWPIRIDPAQLDQVLANLCVNARDAIEDVGTITIETDNVVLDEHPGAEGSGSVSGEYVLLAVSDDGCGMDQETLRKVFEPFFTTKGVGKGTGLGLATLYGIVRQHEGFINVYSEVGHGTTFKIYLPRHTGCVEDAEVVADDEVPAGRGETVLVAEDEESILRLVEKVLEGLGYRVLSAGSPSEALALAEQHEGEIDLLLTDVIMPEMNGKELADRLATRHPGLRRLYMSGYTADVIAHRGVLSDATLFLQKPFSRRDIATKIRAALD